MAELGDNMNALVLADPGATSGEPAQGTTEATPPSDATPSEAGPASTEAPCRMPSNLQASVDVIRAVAASFNLMANPGATPGAQVGTAEWMQTLFPPREGNHTLTFGKDKAYPVSFAEEFLVKHFDFWEACFASSTVENNEKTTSLPDTTADAFAIILAYLIVGGFPEIPMGGPTATQVITDRLEAVRLADFLGQKTRSGLSLVVENETRRLLEADRMALQWQHLDKVFDETAPKSLRAFVEIFANAAVKPFLCGWMRDAKVKTIEASVAGQDIKKDVFKFKAIIRHYDQLTTHLDFQTEVFQQVQQTIRNSKRLNKLPIDEVPATKQLKNLPETVDHVTYLDPLPICIGTDSLFTI